MSPARRDGEGRREVGPSWESLVERQIREAAEAAWWDELQEQASTRLVAIAGDHLRQVISRGGVEAKVVGGDPLTIIVKHNDAASERTKHLRAAE